jgi:hypothetical protein
MRGSERLLSSLKNPLSKLPPPREGGGRLSHVSINNK